MNSILVPFGHRFDSSGFDKLGIFGGKVRSFDPYLLFCHVVPR